MRYERALLASGAFSSLKEKRGEIIYDVQKTVIGLVICGLLFAQNSLVVSNAAGYDLAQKHALLATFAASASTVGKKNGDVSNRDAAIFLLGLSTGIRL